MTHGAQSNQWHFKSCLKILKVPIWCLRFENSNNVVTLDQVEQEFKVEQILDIRRYTDRARLCTCLWGY